MNDAGLADPMESLLLSAASYPSQSWSLSGWRCTLAGRQFATTGEGVQEGGKGSGSVQSDG